MRTVLEILREERAAKVSGGLYHELQVRMAYNSNRIEGSQLSEEQTRAIFETNTIFCGDSVGVDDVLETLHHFKAVDYVIDIATAKLTEKHIKQLHYIIKHDTSASALSWFAVGEYKNLANTVGGRETAKPGDVADRIKILLARYNAKKKISFDDIVEFHVSFERIHPFQDGNGRVGRLVALKECLKHDITPFIIEDTKKFFYYRGLAEWDSSRGYLLDTFRDAQDTFAKLCDYLTA